MLDNFRNKRYDGLVAVAYAKRWSSFMKNIDGDLEYMLRLILWNPKFKGYKSNCANFASQCLHAGGLLMTDEWHGSSRKAFKDTLSWIGSNSLYKSLMNRGACNSSPIVIRNQKDIKEVATSTEVQPGDPVFFDFQDDGIFEHVGLISGIKGNQLLYSGNTMRRFNRDLSTMFEEGNNIHILKMNR